MEYVIDRVGEERVGIGTDFTQGHGAAFFDYLRHDKGHARRVVPAPSKAVVMPRGLGRLGEWGNLTRAMQRRGWREGRIRRVLGENWMTFLAAAWGE
jgi:membrane dipeptidase